MDGIGQPPSWRFTKVKPDNPGREFSIVFCVQGRLVLPSTDRVWRASGAVCGVKHVMSSERPKIGLNKDVNQFQTS